MSLMITPALQKQFCHFLCADVRFGHYSALNDQCWALGSAIGEPKAVSLVTTYGLRAARMHIFPQFSIENLMIQDPDRFHSRPVVAFSSACFVNLVFSPFPSLDVEYRVWVPDSQLLVGQASCVNNGAHTLTFGIDWRVQLQPLQHGSPMRHAQAGLNTILQGECGGLYPVFYLTGGADPSITDLPGLGHKLLLMPGTRRQVTWAMASHTSLEGSTQQARQYSSSSLDLEQIKLEMADKRMKVYCASPQENLAEKIHRSQDRAYQLLTPGEQKHDHITYVTDRTPDTGNYPSESILEAQPEWNGQTLPEIYLLSFTLLPGRPQVIKGLLQNFLKIQQPDGRIDLRASVNHNLTGHSSIPMLIAQVSELHQYLNDSAWIAEIYPQLIAFLKTWVKLDETGRLVISQLTHPLQLGFSQVLPGTNIELVDLWITLSNPQNIYLLSLIYRETAELLQIARLINQNDDIDWLETIRDQLKAQVTTLLKETTEEPQAEDKPGSRVSTKTILTRFKRNGQPGLKHNLPRAGRIYLRLDQDGKLPADFCCSISGRTPNGHLEKEIKSRDLTQIGNSHVFITREVIEFIESVTITKMPAGTAGEIGLADMPGSNILDLVALYAGIPTASQANRLLAREKVKSHFINAGTSLHLDPGTELPLPIPAYITDVIIEGLIRYNKYDLAAQVFMHSYLQKQAQPASTLANLARCSSMKIEDLVPLRLFLKLHGLIKLSDREIVIAHYDGKQQPVTVQYNQIELLLRHNLTEIRLQSGEVIYLNQAGINKVLLE